MSKRSAIGQGGKDVSEFPESPDEAPVRASAMQLSGRKIASAKSRRVGGGGGGFTSGSSLQALGNPFGGLSADPSSGSNPQPSTHSNMFSQSNGFSFGSQPQNTQPFGSQSVSFPPAQPSSGSNMFGGSFSAPSGGFSFSAGSNNPFTFNQTQAPALSGFSATSGIFGAQPQQAPQQAPQQEMSNGQDMQISPPATPEKGINGNSTPSIFGAISGAPTTKSPFTFGQPAVQQNQSPAAPISQPSANPFNFNPVQSPTTTQKPAATFSFGQAPTTPSATQDNLSQQPSIFSDASTSTEKESSAQADSAPSNIFSNNAMSSTPSASSSFRFGAPPQSSDGQASNSSTPSLFANPSSTPAKGFAFGVPASAPSTEKGLYPSLTKTVHDSSATPAFSGFGSTASTNPFASVRPATSTETTSTSSLASFAQTETAGSTGIASRNAKAESLRTDSEGCPSGLNDGQQLSYESHLQLRTLNIAFQQALANADANASWSGLAEAYSAHFNTMLSSQAGTNLVSSTEGSSSPAKRRAEDELEGDNSKRSRAVESSSSQAPSDKVTGRSQTATLFQNILDKKDTPGPTTPTKSSDFASFASTTPAGPPPLANPFASVKTVQAPSAGSPFFSFKPTPSTAPTSSLFSPKSTNDNVPQSSSSLFAAPANTGSADKASQAPVKDSVTSTFSSNTLFSPKPNAAPSGALSNGSHNFLAQFGSKAAKDSNKLAAEAKAKAKAEDFDSDEDNEEEWERKYEEEQLKKKVENPTVPTFAMPKFAAAPANGSVDFLSQFGSGATKNAEKMAAEEKAKRKAEEFDSDEDNEEEWERKYEEEQRQKKANVANSHVAFSPTFGPASQNAAPQVKENATQGSQSTQSASVFAASNGHSWTTNSTNNIFGNLAKAGAKSTPTEEGNDDEDDDRDNDEGDLQGSSTTRKASQNRSLFDRVDQDEQASNGDHTWKENTPIKFGGKSPPAFSFAAPIPTKPAAPTDTNGTTTEPRPFGNLCSTAKPAATTSLFGQSNVFPTNGSGDKSASVGFSFGNPAKTDNPTPSLFPPANASGFSSVFGSGVNSAMTSRASSPGIPPSTASNDGGETDADADDAEPPINQSDFTALSEEEKRNEDILFEVEKARCSLFNKGAESPWETKGTGPLRVLRNKGSGAVRILLRIAPSGRVTLNNRLNKGFTFTFAGKGTTRLLIVGSSGTPETWAVKMARDEDAKRFAEVCEENKGA